MHRLFIRTQTAQSDQGRSLAKIITRLPLAHVYVWPITAAISPDPPLQKCAPNEWV